MIKLYRKTYSNCDEMPMYNFVKVLTTGNMKYLLANNDSWKLKPDLQEAWERIFMDYTDRMNDPRSQKTFLIIKELNLLGNNINIATNCIQLLSKVGDIDKFRPTIEALKSSLGYYGMFTEQTIEKDLKQCVSRLKLLKIRQKEVYNEYKTLIKDDQEKASEADFTGQIVAFEKFFAVPIDIRNISVAKYISYLSAINAEK